MRDPLETTQKEHVGRERLTGGGGCHGRHDLRKRHLAELRRCAQIAWSTCQRLASFLGKRLSRLRLEVSHDAVGVDRNASHGTEAEATHLSMCHTVPRQEQCGRGQGYGHTRPDRPTERDD